MIEDQKALHNEAEADDRALFGFWVYLMTDLLMFAVLFAVYAVLHHNTLGGEKGKDLFSYKLAFVNTVLLLTSSFTCGLGMIAVQKSKRHEVLMWFSITFLLGLLFLGLEAFEFRDLIGEGYNLGTNAFLSSFFVLLGTHGVHIIAGLIWLGAILAYMSKRGLNSPIKRKLMMLSLYWHFLDIVWIFIFTVVYLGAFV